MKLRPLSLALVALTAPISSHLQGQGTLAPAGAPAPSMKRLDQVEPRRDLNTLAGDASSLVLINTPGSYYLSANLATSAGRAGIAIAAPNVTIDLRGFAIDGAAGGTNGIEIRSGASITILNGNISNFSGGAGVSISGGGLANIRVQGLHVRSCGSGILSTAAYSGLFVEDAVVTNCSGAGIDLTTAGEVRRSVVDSCLATSSTLYGIRAALVSDCRVHSQNNVGGASFGISSAGSVTGCTVSNVSGSAGGTAGISAATVTGCSVTSVSLTTSGGLTGILATGRIADCTVDGVGTGTSSGSPIGLSGGVVSGCRASNVGGASNTGGTTAISAGTGTVDNCSVFQYGNSSPNSVTGIGAQVISRCYLNLGSGSGAVVGALGSEVSHCTIDVVQQLGGASVAAGVSATRVSDTSVTAVSAVGNTVTYGFSQYRMAINCSASAISNNNDTQIAFNASSGAQTINCSVSGTGGVGIQAGQSGSIVRGCRIELGDAGTGISVGSNTTRHRLEENVISNCATGLNAPSGSGLIARNRVTNCATNINAGASWQVGPVVTTANISTASPWANFTD